jgi:PTH2 family peptidyl-tRNA hydrolase
MSRQDKERLDLMEAKQVIVVRKDLKMRKGKIAAQVAHASLGAILSQMEKQEYSHVDDNNLIVPCLIHTLVYKQGSAADNWINGMFTKVVVSCDSEKELLDIYEDAKNKGLVATLITDSGKTEFHGEATHTCLAVGPGFVYKVDEVTGHLPLL